MFISKKDYKVMIDELYYLRKRNILLEYIENSICISCNDICENRYKKPIDESCIKEYLKEYIDNHRKEIRRNLADRFFFIK